MNGVKEYIFPVYDVDADEFKEYLGFIRTKPELIRCKDCEECMETKLSDGQRWNYCELLECIT